MAEEGKTRTRAAKTAPPPKVARKGDRHQEAVKLIRRMIMSGELAPGQPLREVTLSEQLGMSRTPVREAFRTLAAEGLVNLLPNRTVQVSHLDEEATAEVFVVLGALEALAARVACERMTTDELEQLSELQSDLEAYFVSGDRNRYLEANRLIHELIVESSHNQSLLLAWRLLLPRAERARHVSTLDVERWKTALAEHREIHAALLSRNAERLESLMFEHFNNGAESIQRERRRARARRRAESYEAAANANS